MSRGKKIEEPSTDETSIKNLLAEYMEDEKVYGWTPDLTEGKVVEYTMTPCYGRKEYRVDREIARDIKQAAIYGINWYVTNKTKRLSLSYDLDGVNTFYEYLKKNKLTHKNFDFLNYYRIRKLDLTESYLNEVCRENNLIIFEQTKGITSPMFYNKEKFKFNIEIVDYQPKTLTDEEALWYIGDKGDYSGLYSVEGALMSKEQAIEVIKENICVERIKIKLIIAMDRKDVVHIEFKNNAFKGSK